MKKILTFAVLAAVVWFGYSRSQARTSLPVVPPAQAQVADTPPQQVTPRTNPGQFSCDGREHCSQMRSCAEATYFIQHCPNTKMDGNNDGVPCERQWCK